MEFKAAVLFEQKQPLKIIKIKHSGTLLPGQVLVKIFMSGICGSQLGEIDGVKGYDKYLPHLLGHEGAGVVEKVGPGVSKVDVGSKVILHWKQSGGIDAPVPNFDFHGEVINAGPVTTFSEYSIVSENRITPMPDGLTFSEAALFGCAITTGFGVVRNDAQVQMGDNVVILGAGGIGLNIIQACSLVSANSILAIDLFNDRLLLAETMGATHTINSSSMDLETLRSQIENVLAGKDIDVFIDNTGNTKIIELGYEMAKADGKVVLVGVPNFGENIEIHSLDIHFGKRLIGSHGGNSQPHKDIPRYHQLMNSKSFDIGSLISKFYSLDEINLAISDMKAGKVAGRCMINMHGF